jgi:hypothetical protein
MRKQYNNKASTFCPASFGYLGFGANWSEIVFSHARFCFAEADWTYAARSGTHTRFAQGDELTPDRKGVSVMG